MSNEQTYLPIEKMEVFRLFEEVSDWTWKQVNSWPRLAQDTIGKQVIRSADSINANLVEGDGRRTDADALHFFVIARGSARETRLGIQRAVKRGLVPTEEGEKQIALLESGARLLNILIGYRHQSSNKKLVKESIVGGWGKMPVSDPFEEAVY